MHFLTILALATSATAGVAGGRHPDRPLWNQRGQVRAGHGFESTASFIERTQNLARDAKDAVQAQPPFKADDDYEAKYGPGNNAAWSKLSSDMYDKWNSVANGVSQKAKEAVELAKAQAANRGGEPHTLLRLRDVDDEDEAMHDVYARSKDNKLKSPTPGSPRYYLHQRDVDDDYAEDAADEVEVYLDSNDDDKAAYDDEDDTSDLVARDTEDVDEDDGVDPDWTEDELTAHEPTGEEEAPSGEPEEETLDDTAGIEARDADADPEPRRLFRLGQIQSKVVSMLYARGAEDEEDEEELAARGIFERAWPTGWSHTASTAPTAPPPRPAHQTVRHGGHHGHLHRPGPELRAGRTKTRTQNERRFLDLD